MANKHMKRCPTLYVIRELQIKTVRRHCTPTGTTETQKAHRHQLLVRSNRTSQSRVGVPRWYIRLGRQFKSFLKAKCSLTIQASNRTPKYLPSQFENLCPTKTCMQLFIAALLVITENWKKPRCPSVDEEIIME